MIDVEINIKIKKCLLSPKEINSIVLNTSKKEKKIKGIVEINVIGDSEMTKMNFEHRGKKYPTDVLSFSWQEDSMIKTDYLGQIYICQNQIKRQSKDWEATDKEEFARMLVHGLLHLVGYDHLVEKDAKKMFGLQEKILKELKYVS